ncbi:MAG: MerR family transcriptional regulator [Bacteroidia bacterium]|nr:MerR family transcriptional regulator [Bacteroidia bacterium]
MPTLKNETEIQKMFYKMGEVSKLIGVAPSMLRFWEKEFDCLKNLNKNRKGDRLYTVQNLEDLKTIHYLVKEKGYTLQGANEYMQGNRHGNDKNNEILKSLEKIKSFLNELKQNL